MTRRAAWLAALVTLAGCATDDLPADAATRARFDLSGDVDDPAAFYRHPWPSDLRLDEDGRPRLAGLPRASGRAAVEGLVELAGDRHGFPVTPVAYFTFDGPLAPLEGAEPIAADPASPVLLIDVDPASPNRGALVPTLAATLPLDPYVPEPLLAVAAAPGFVLRAGRTYAAVITREVRDADGARLGVPDHLATLAAGAPPDAPWGEAARAALEPLWETLDALGVPRGEVAAATVFTTGDAVAETTAMSDAILAAHDVAITDLTLDPTDHPRFCALQGAVGLPQFQVGTPPFDTEGRFALDVDGMPVEQGTLSTPIVITLPRAPMPEGGFPVVVYVHGSGGLSTQVVDRGPVTEPGGAQTPGLGPAHWLARHGFAAVGLAMPVNPERLPGATSREYLNFENLTAYRDTFRQGAFELRLVIEALDGVRVDPAALAGCDGVQLGGAAQARLDAGDVYVMGQSMGAQYATMLGAMEPRVAAVVPTGSGGYWSLLVMEPPATGGLTPDLVGLVLGTRQPLHLLHPGLALLQTAWEAGDPIAYMPRIAAAPLPGHAPTSLFVPVAEGDSFFPEAIFDAAAIAYGVRQAGEEVWPALQRGLALAGRAGLEDYPVAHNLGGDAPFTGVVVQHRGDGLADPHHVFMQLPELRHQWSCLFRSHRDTGRATVFGPADADAPCPSEDLP